MGLFCVHFSTADGILNMDSSVNDHTRTALQYSVAVVFVYRLVIYATQVFMEQYVLLSKSLFSSNDSHVVLNCWPVLMGVGTYVGVAALVN